MKLTNNDENYRKYKQSLLLVLKAAMHKLYPRLRLVVHQSVGKAAYCELENELVTPQMLEAISREMRTIISENLPILVFEVDKAQAAAIFHQQGELEKSKKMKKSLAETVRICKIGDNYMSLYQDTFPETGVLESFELAPFGTGFLLKNPQNVADGIISEFTTSKKLIETLIEYKKWSEIINVSDVYGLNSQIEAGNENEIMNISESLHNKKISQLSDKIKKDPKIKLVLISGPSASGKTTFAKRLNIDLRVNKVTPITISLDNYFYNKKDLDGVSLEDIDAIDYELFNDHAARLIRGETVKLPYFDFTKGERVDNALPTTLSDGQILIVEGIHALNEKLSHFIDRQNKYKIYCTPLTVINFDEYNPISATDTRFLRRLVRDYRFRSSDCEATFSMWEEVRRGEMRNIFPFEPEADDIFNSSLPYEFSVLKPYAQALLSQVTDGSKYYDMARFLWNFLSNFEEIKPDFVPPTSILKEFIGGSSIK